MTAFALLYPKLGYTLNRPSRLDLESTLSSAMITPLRHRIFLFSTMNLFDPFDSQGSIQLNTRFRTCQSILIIHYTSSDNLQSLESGPVAVQRAPAVSTKVARNDITAVCFLGDALGFTRSDFECILWHDDVSGIGASRDFSTVKAVAKGLLRQFDDVATFFLRPLTFIAGSPVYSILTFPQKQLPVGIFANKGEL